MSHPGGWEWRRKLNYFLFEAPSGMAESLTFRILLVMLPILFPFSFVHSVSFADPIVINHTCTDLSQIPDNWIDIVQANIKWHYSHTSHGTQLTTGLQRIEGADSKYSVNRSTSSLPTEPGALCVKVGMTPIRDTYNRPDEYFSSNWQKHYYVQNFLNHPDYIAINVSAFCWCCQMNSYTEETVNSYLQAMSNLENDNPNVTFIYFTGNAQATGSSGYNRYLRNEQIREWVRQGDNRVLFDFADLDSWWYNTATGEWEQENYLYDNGSKIVSVPSEHPQYHGKQAGHTTYESCEQKGRAVWWMLARIAGWNPSVRENQSPVANAGPDRTVNEGVMVTLDGSNSYDQDGTIVSYYWIQETWVSVTLSE